MNDHVLLDLARHFHGTGHILRFIEYMDVGTLNEWKPDHVVPADEILRRINAEMPLQPVGPNYKGEVSRRYSYRNGGGEIGIISSVTRPFCGDCTRARLSTEGKVYTCLFAGRGTDLRGPIRHGASDDELLKLILETWRRRSDRYSQLRAEETPRASTPPKVEMHRIGG